MAPDDKRKILVVESEGGIRLSDVTKFLVQIEDAYNRVLLLLMWLDELVRLKREPGISHLHNSITVNDIDIEPSFDLLPMKYWPLAILAGTKGRPLHFTNSSAASLVGRSQSLILSSVRLESPGNWKLLGVSDSLEVLRKYLNDRHERKKDKQYREITDEERRHLENELLRTKVLSEKIKVAKELGAKEEDLSPLLGALLFDPLDDLGVFQDRGLITDATVIDPDDPKIN